MTAQAATAAAQPGAANSPPGMARPHGSTGAAAAVPGAYTRKDAHPMRDQPSVTDLVTKRQKRRQTGMGRAGGAVRPLIWSICRRHQLADADAHGASGQSWRTS
jgi:hypothetical protein